MIDVFIKFDDEFELLVQGIQADVFIWLDPSVGIICFSS